MQPTGRCDSAITIPSHVASKSDGVPDDLSRPVPPVRITIIRVDREQFSTDNGRDQQDVPS
jgi:hypothetical protein